MRPTIPNIDSDQATKIRRNITSGTTTPERNVRVMWIGEHCALVHYRYPSDSRSGHVSPEVWLIYTDGHDLGGFTKRVSRSRYSEKVIHVCSRQEPRRAASWGPPTHALVADLIQRAKKADEARPEQVKRARAQEEEARRREREEEIRREEERAREARELDRKTALVFKAFPRLPHNAARRMAREMPDGYTG